MGASCRVMGGGGHKCWVHFGLKGTSIEPQAVKGRGAGRQSGWRIPSGPLLLRKALCGGMGLCKGVIFTYPGTYVPTYLHTYLGTYVRTYIHTYVLWKVKNFRVVPKYRNKKFKGLRLRKQDASCTASVRRSWHPRLRPSFLARS